MLIFRCSKGFPSCVLAQASQGTRVLAERLCVIYFIVKSILHWTMAIYDSIRNYLSNYKRPHFYWLSVR